MSQICPSSSHQLVAAAIAFRRARRKFPRNYGLSVNLEETPTSSKLESCGANDDRENRVAFSSMKRPNSRSGRVCASTNSNDDRTSPKESVLLKPIICSCCRKRSEAAKINESINILKPGGDERSAGDALDTVPSRECNKLATAAANRNEFYKLEQHENFDGKTAESSPMESKDFARCHSLSYPQRQPPKGTSKLDSVNLLYDRFHGKKDDLKYCKSSDEQNCNAEKYNCNFGRQYCKANQPDSRSNLGSFAPQRDNASCTGSCNCDIHSKKHSSLDLLQRPDYRRRQRSSHCHDCCQKCNSCSIKEKPCRTSDTCLCPAAVNYCKTHSGNATSVAGRNSWSKSCGKISSVLEQNDEEYDDGVAVINHKDSLCILVEKYKASKKCRRKEFTNDPELSNDRINDESDKSLNLEIGCQSRDNGNINAGQAGMSVDNDGSEENRSTLAVKICGHGCGQIFREGDGRQAENLRCRLIKAENCFTPKSTPWSHTF